MPNVKHNYVAVNCSLQVKDVAIILQWLHASGYTNMSRGQAIKLATHHFAQSILEKYPDLALHDVRAAHAVVETLAPLAKRAMTLNMENEVEE